MRQRIGAQSLELPRRYYWRRLKALGAKIPRKPIRSGFGVRVKTK